MKNKVQDERWKSPSEAQITHKGMGERTVGASDSFSDIHSSANSW